MSETRSSTPAKRRFLTSAFTTAIIAAGLAGAVFAATRPSRESADWVIRGTADGGRTLVVAASEGRAACETLAAKLVAETSTNVAIEVTRTKDECSDAPLKRSGPRTLTVQLGAVLAGRNVSGNGLNPGPWRPISGQADWLPEALPDTVGLSVEQAAGVWNAVGVVVAVRGPTGGWVFKQSPAQGTRLKARGGQLVRLLSRPQQPAR